MSYTKFRFNWEIKHLTHFKMAAIVAILDIRMEGF